MHAIKLAAGVLAVGALAATTACSQSTPTRNQPKTQPVAKTAGAPTAGLIRQVDWKNVTLNLPKIELPNSRSCPAAPVHFRNGVDSSRTWELREKGKSAVLAPITDDKGIPAPVYGDLRGSGGIDALIGIACVSQAPGTTEVTGADALVGVQLDAAGKPTVMGLVTVAPLTSIADVSLAGGVVKVERSHFGEGATRTIARYHWDGKRFASVK